MSTGLMSCVRQNSPPLELSASSDEPPSSRATTISAATAQRMDDVSSLNTTQKRRRRFLPLRNLFRIFRIGTPDEHSLSSSAYRPASEPEQSDDNTGTGGGSRLSPPDTPIRVVASTAYPNSTSCDSLLYSPQRPHREQRRRQASTGKFDQNARCQHKPVLHLRKSRESLYRENVDSTDFQRRSISEYLGGDLKSDSLSQSHDSVFSESVTASSMSIGLKAELASVLRKKYHERSVSSDHNVEVEEDEEDLGFPRSPNTPKRGERLLSSSVPASSPMKHSHNLSSEGSLSMMSSMGSSELMHSPSSGMGASKVKILKIKSDSQDDISDRPTPLNHSAARHKMAVRPKKKAPSRISRIPTVNEVDPHVYKPDQTDEAGVSIETNNSSSHLSGVDAGQSHGQVEIKMAKSSSVTTTISKQLYVNSEMSKSYSFESNSQNISEKDKEVNGFFRRLLTRGSLKKKVIDEPSSSSSALNTVLQVVDTTVSVDASKPKVAVKPEKPKSGPAARQRILPREILGTPQKKSDPEGSPPTKPSAILAKTSVNNSSDHFPSASQSIRKSVVVLPASPNVSPKKITDSLPPKPTPVRTFDAKPIKSSKFVFGNGVTRVSSDYQIKSKDEAITTDNYHRSEEHLFPRKVQSQSTSCIARTTIAFDHPRSPTRKPVEKSRSFRFYSETATESPIHSTMPSLPDLSFTSPGNTNDSPNYRELINRFEINDNNLMGQSSKSTKPEPMATGSRNTVYVTTTYDATVDPELTDKSFCKPSLPSNVIKLPSAESTTSGSSNITQIEDNIDHIMKFACVTVCKTTSPPMSKSESHKTSHSSVNATSYVKQTSLEDEPKERRFSNESVEITDKPTQNAKTNTAGVVVERRKSVSDEKLKFERKIQERCRNTTIADKEQSSRKSSLSEGDAIGSPAVVLRKKSMSYGSRTSTTVVSTSSTTVTGPGDEPELMKVFARRSLKLKDQDDFVVCSGEDEPAPTATTTKATEAVVKPIAAVTAIASPRTTPQPTVTPVTKSVTKSTINTTAATVSSSSSSQLPLHTASVASRLSGYHGLIANSTTTTTSTNHSNNKSISSALLKPATLITNTLVGSNNQNQIPMHNNSNHNNNNNINLVKNAQKGSCFEDDVNDNHLVDDAIVKVRKSSPHLRATICETGQGGGADEFKGILQRRAEWEKRATQTFK